MRVRILRIIYSCPDESNFQVKILYRGKMKFYAVMYNNQIVYNIMSTQLVTYYYII